MAEFNSRATQHDVPLAAAAELSVAGFEDAVVIGRGGFGVVFRCLQRSLDRTVAVKLLTSGVDPENLDRFFREQRAMGRLSGHPNIVNVLQVGVTSTGLPYIVMQYHSRGSLDGRIRQEGPLTWGEALRLGVQMAGALETAHRHGVLHRDVKPANILITEYGDSQLTDFGIAHMAGAFETTAGTVTGSPAFTAPEVLAGDAPSPSSDIYSLGATLFCAITGHAPFERRVDEQVVAQFLRISTEPAPNLVGQGLPDDVREAIEHAMARNAEERPASSADFGDQLRAIEYRHNRPVDDMALPADTIIEDRADGTRQVNDGGLATELSQLPQSSPPRTGTGPTRTKSGNLPIELTSFVGRRRELAEAKKTLSASRLVTLTGIGGVGKTRLALAVATSSRRAFKDGVWLIELGEMQDKALVAETISTALGLRRQLPDAQLPLLADYLSDKRLLLVLDNCEHLLGPVATLVHSLLRTCSGLRVLATSREPLGISGEASMRIPPMSVPEADRTTALRSLPQYESVTLFIERATSVVPQFGLTDDNQAAVAQICQKLDGLPLAIELAAVRLRAMSAQQILDRLTDRYRLLNVGSRVAPSRQQTLRLCIDWSYELCTPQEQQLWARLTVFSSGFELDAAEAICGETLSPEGLLDAVASLVDKSILIREEPGPEVRYRLLETLREYGRERLQTSGEYAALRRRHRDWYEQLVLRTEADWISPRQLQWITRLERDQANLREALSFCLTDEDASGSGLRIAGALFPFWHSRGHLSEGRLWLDRILAMHSRQGSPDRAKALCADSVLAGAQGDIEAGTTLLTEANEITAQLGDIPISVFAGFAAGGLALAEAHPAQAVTYFEESLATSELNGLLLRKIGCLFGLALSYVMLGDATRALAYCEKLLAVTEAHGESIYRGRTSLAAGWAMWKKGDPERAITALKQGLRLSQLADDPVGSARCLQTLAWIEADQHRELRAAVLLGAADGMWRDTGGGHMFSFLDAVVYQQECEHRTGKALGSREFAKQFRHGRGLSVEEAVEYAFAKHIQEQPAHSVDAAPGLTRREREVAFLVAEGLTNRAIAAKLVISQRTAQGHVEHILAKLGFNSRAQIAAWVVDRGKNSGDL